MLLPQPYKCDYCDVLKGEANHWWLLAPAEPAHVPYFKLAQWNDRIKDLPDVKHICSEQCAGKAMSRWMASLTKDTVPK